MIDPIQFGLTKETEVVFITPEESAKIPGVKSGYNAIYRIGANRVRYELLKAGKNISGGSVDNTVTEVAPSGIDEQQPVVTVAQVSSEEVTIPAVVEPEKTEEIVPTPKRAIRKKQ